MNNSVAKYAPKARTYSTTMALTNRVMIAIGTSNLGYVTFWEKFFPNLALIMNTDTRSFLLVKDQNHTYRKKYSEKIETKQRRVKIKNQKMKELMAKQRIDERRGATYGAGVAIESDTFQIPPLIKETEAKKKIQLKIDCPWSGCYKKGHKTNRSKLYKYWGKTNDNSFATALEIYLKSEYPDQYGKSPPHGADDLSHPMVPTMLLQYDFIVFGGVYRFDVCLLWEIILKKSDFFL